MKWRTRDGRVLDIVDMEIDHLRNTINMLRNKGYATPADMMSICSYLASDPPDGAYMCAEAEMMNMRISPVLAAMERELERR